MGFDNRLAAAGVEFHNGKSEGGYEQSGEAGHVDEDESNFLFRMGAGYDVHLGGSFGPVPTVNLDVVKNENVEICGVALCDGF